VWCMCGVWVWCVCCVVFVVCVVCVCDVCDMFVWVVVCFWGVLGAGGCGLFVGCGMCVNFFFIHHSRLHGTTTCFTVKYSKKGYI
jgi:hypothetical protein